MMDYLRIILFTLLFAFCFNNLKADDDFMTLQKKVDKMDTLLAEKYREKIYLQTDRPVYNLQDTVWYKALVLQSGSLQPTEKSRILYVDLINERNVIVQSSQCLIEGGTSCGRFVLPFTQNEKGTFRIRAYTRWMKNFSDTICGFEKRIPIWSDEKEKKEKKYIAIYKIGRSVVSYPKTISEIPGTQEEKHRERVGSTGTRCSISSRRWQTGCRSA